MYLVWLLVELVELYFRMVVIVYNKMKESIKMEQFKRMTEDDLSVVSGGSKLQCAVTQAGGALAGFGAGTALGPWGSVAGFAIGYQYATSKYC